MSRVTRVLSLLLMTACLCAVSGEAQAHTVFKNILAKKYPNKKINCNACHVQGEVFVRGVEDGNKKFRNSFGQMYTKLMGIENLSQTYKGLKSDEKKQYENEVMIPAFEKAYEKLKSMSYEDMLEAGLINGVEDK